VDESATGAAKLWSKFPPKVQGGSQLDFRRLESATGSAKLWSGSEPVP
jgi:hypothetical protein